MLNSNARTGDKNATRYTQKPENIRNQTIKDATTTAAAATATEEKKTKNIDGNLEIITEESVIQYLNEILSVYLNELSSPPATPYDNETFFFEKPVTRNDSKIFDIHYSNEGRQRRRQKSLKAEPSNAQKHDKIRSSQGKQENVFDSGHVKMDKNLTKSGYQSDFSRKNISIDRVNDEKFHAVVNTTSQIDPTRPHNEINTNIVTHETGEKTLRKVCSIPLDNSSTKLDIKQKIIDKNNNNSSNYVHQNDLSRKTIRNCEPQDETKQKLTPSISAPHKNNNNKGRAKSMIIDNHQRNEQYLGRSTNRSTRTRSSSSREQPNKEFTVSLYKTTTSPATTTRNLGSKTGGESSLENTKLVCTMYMS